MLNFNKVTPSLCWMATRIEPPLFNLHLFHTHHTLLVLASDLSTERLHMSYAVMSFPSQDGTSHQVVCFLLLSV